jgi:hypothetical protein
MADDPRKLRNTLFWYAFALACVTTLLISIVFVTLGPAVSPAAVLSAIGLNLIASVVFALVFTALSTWVQQNAIEGAVADQFLDATAKLRGEIAATNLTYLPIATYSPLDPVDGYGDYFNIDMTRSLEKTSFYAFRGPSARYVAARLRRARSYPQEVRVAMLNPGDSAAISRRSSDRLQWLRSEGKTAADLERELHDELIITVVSLFDYRKICPVQLLYVEDTAVYRYEMFDDSVFVSWYHGPQSAGRELPESLRFSDQSFMYSTMKLDLIRRFEISSHQAVFRPSQGDDYLIGHLAEYAGITATPQDIADWRKRYVEYVEDFCLYLDKIYSQI